MICTVWVFLQTFSHFIFIHFIFRSRDSLVHTNPSNNQAQIFGTWRLDLEHQTELIRWAQTPLGRNVRVREESEKKKDKGIWSWETEVSRGNSLSCPIRSVAAVSGLESRGGDVSFSLTVFLLLFLSWTVWGGFVRSSCWGEILSLSFIGQYREIVGSLCSLLLHYWTHHSVI